MSSWPHLPTNMAAMAKIRHGVNATFAFYLENSYSLRKYDRVEKYSECWDLPIVNIHQKCQLTYYTSKVSVDFLKE